MPVLNVSQFLTLVNASLRTIPSGDFLVEGEISDFRIAQQKWVSFDLKDEKAQAVLKCFMTVWQMGVPVENGMRVRVSGSPNVYERFGTFKMNVQTVQPVGEGALARAYTALKEKLQVEGLFDQTRKRALPRFPERIALITSRDAAAYGDFLRVLDNRWGGVTVLFHHVHVQGREAVEEILGAFESFQRLPITERPQVLVLTRGGGGLEDLHAFNDERVARAVFGSVIPVVCAVGHERDESLCDFVADVRASTPSNAAERVTPSREEIAYELLSMTRHMDQRMRRRIEVSQERIVHAASAMRRLLGLHAERFQRLTHFFVQQVEGWQTRLSDRVESHRRVLKQLDPRRVLERGYAIVRLDGKALKNASALDKGQRIGVQLHQGGFDAEVTNTMK